jgi:hypothetical protein
LLKKNPTKEVFFRFTKKLVKVFGVRNRMMFNRNPLSVGLQNWHKVLLKKKPILKLETLCRENSLSLQKTLATLIAHLLNFSFIPFPNLIPIGARTAAVHSHWLPSSHAPLITHPAREHLRIPSLVIFLKPSL